MILFNEAKNLNVDINLSTTEHAFTQSCERCIYMLLWIWRTHKKNMIIDKDTDRQKLEKLVKSEVVALSQTRNR